MEIKFSQDIKTNLEGYQKLLSVLDDAKLSQDTDIYFDFSKVEFLEANLCAVLATIIEILETLGKKIYLKNGDKC